MYRFFDGIQISVMKMDAETHGSTVFRSCPMMNFSYEELFPKRLASERDSAGRVVQPNDSQVELMVGDRVAAFVQLDDSECYCWILCYISEIGDDGFHVVPFRDSSSHYIVRRRHLKRVPLSDPSDELSVGDDVWVLWRDPVSGRCSSWFLAGRVSAINGDMLDYEIDTPVADHHVVRTEPRDLAFRMGPEVTTGSFWRYAMRPRGPVGSPAPDDKRRVAVLTGTSSTAEERLDIAALDEYLSKFVKPRPKRPSRSVNNLHMALERLCKGDKSFPARSG